MIIKYKKLTMGLIVSGLICTTLIIQNTKESVKTINGNVIGTFSAGAISAINETVVLEESPKDDVEIKNIFTAIDINISNNDVPVVALSAEENIFKDIAIAEVDTFLNIRAEANEKSEVLGKIYNNGAAKVLEVLDGWYKIESGNVTGYVCADYVTVGDKELCKNVSIRIGKVTAEAVRVRKEPSLEADTYTIISNGYEVEVVDESDVEWIKVIVGEYVGYIHSDYIELDYKFNYAESKEEEAARIASEKARKEKNNKKNNTEKEYNPPSGENGQAVVDYAVQFVGNPYVWGGESLTNGADCSGFVKAIFAKFGASLPHSSASLRSVGYGIKESDVKPGDIICYSGHVAIYIGDGKIVHASSRKEGIKISNNWRYREVLAIRRIF
jgi:uncharacterized protein YgiM (DUF1202 family)